MKVDMATDRRMGDYSHCLIGWKRAYTDCLDHNWTTMMVGIRYKAADFVHCWIGHRH